MTNCRGTITVLLVVAVVVTAYASTWNHHSPPPSHRRHALTVNVLCLASLTGYLGYVGLLCIRDTQ